MVMVNNFIPSAKKGHVLLTTIAQTMGITAQKYKLEKMRPDEEALFLAQAEQQHHWTEYH